jgi:HicB family
MDLAPYVDGLRRELVAAAAAGGDDARALAERLTGALDAATRLALLEALSDAAATITAELAPGSVDVRLRGRDADFVVVPPPADALPADPPAADPPAAYPTPDAGDVNDVQSDVTATSPEGDDAALARITLRLPESLKARAEAAAGRDGVSLNAWLVRAVAAAVDAPAGPIGPSGRAGRTRRTPPGGRSLTGWAR